MVDESIRRGESHDVVGVREAVGLMGQGARIVAVTYAPGAQKGTWQPWVAMGSAKASLESLVRYFAVTLAPRGITVNSVSPGLTEDSVLNGLPQAVVDTARAWHASGWTPMGRMGTPADIGTSSRSSVRRTPPGSRASSSTRTAAPRSATRLAPLEIQRG